MNLPVFTGKVLCFGDEVNTDVLHPTRFFSLDASTVQSGFTKGVGNNPSQTIMPQSQQNASIIVAGRNFGYGSSRETTLQTLKLNGIQIVLADTISRIFYRNAVNLGLWVLEVGELAKTLQTFEALSIDLAASTVSSNGVLLASLPKLPRYSQTLLMAGGMRPWLADDCPI